VPPRDRGLVNIAHKWNEVVEALMNSFSVPRRLHVTADEDLSTDQRAVRFIGQKLFGGESVAIFAAKVVSILPTRR
jgi:hypothetical protein